MYVHVIYNQIQGNVVQMYFYSTECIIWIKLNYTLHIVTLWLILYSVAETVTTYFKLFPVSKIVT